MKHSAALPVLMYHHVSPSPGLVTVSPETFRDHLAWLKAQGYRSVGAADLAAFLAGRPLAPRSVMISFDDGYLDNYVYAHPALAEFGFQAVLFLITGHIGDGPPRPCQGEGGALPPTPAHRQCMACWAEGRADEVMLRWSEVERMAAAGTFEFHSHTHTHTRWDQVEAEPERRRELLRQDLEASRATLARHLGGDSPHLCWPQGYYDDLYQQVARETGFTHLYTVCRGTNTRRTDPQHIRRVVVKDKPARWLGSRLRVYGHPLLASLYTAVHPE